MVSLITKPRPPVPTRNLLSPSPGSSGALDPFTSSSKTTTRSTENPLHRKANRGSWGQRQDPPYLVKAWASHSPSGITVQAGEGAAHSSGRGGCGEFQVTVPAASPLALRLPGVAMTPGWSMRPSPPFLSPRVTVSPSSRSKTSRTLTGSPS